MKLSSRTRYGMRTMIDLAANCARGPVLLKDICRRQDLSLKYLDQIITNLKSAGLVKNSGGGHSGYILSRSADSIYASDIVSALEGGLSVRECVDDPELCARSSRCVPRKLWKKVEKSIKESLRVSLSDLAKEQKKMKGRGENNAGA
ncbi:MAG: Rrf2 family transcriptional regulator [Elusimicrobia bacterium]|nr:Rrf2 family transcriptional regulator [Elusimicrobiota bacterium]